jgi:uncharacterized membrane protein (UPF0182 family)
MAWGIGAAAGAHVVLLGILPAAIHAVYVDPNEFARERPYLEHNIAFTRMAFGIDGVSERSYAAATGLEMRDLADNHDTIRNIRLWDYRPLLRTFRQIQQIRLYYQFYDVDVDRYLLADGYRQTMLAARELTPELPERAETWVNRHLQYTHGYGFAMSLAAQEGEEGTPTLVVRDLPPVATRDALWDQRGSRVLRGNLLVIPIDHSLLYVEPVYLIAEQNDLPQLKRMIVAHGGRVAMEPTLDGALAALFGPPVSASQATNTAQSPALLGDIRARLADAEKALARGDWAGFGAAMDELKQAAERGRGRDVDVPKEDGLP